MLAKFFLSGGKIQNFTNQHNLLSDLADNQICITEKIWFCKGKIPLWDDHIELFLQKFQLQHIPYPELINNPLELKRQAFRLINKNKGFLSGIISLNFLIHEKTSENFILCYPLEEKGIRLSSKSLLLDYFSEIKHTQNKYSEFDFYSQLLWNSVKMKSIHSKYDGFIICNEENEIIEYPEANIFFIRENCLLTPAENTGCYVDRLRRVVLDSAKDSGLRVVECSSISKLEVAEMEEAFIASECIGVQKIMGIGTKRFIHEATRKIHEKLNKILLEAN